MGGRERDVERFRCDMYMDQLLLSVFPWFHKYILTKNQNKKISPNTAYFNIFFNSSSLQSLVHGCWVQHSLLVHRLPRSLPGATVFPGLACADHHQHGALETYSMSLLRCCSP